MVYYVLHSKCYRCLMDGGNLSSIHSNFEFESITKLTRHSERPIWLGLIYLKNGLYKMTLN